MRIVYEFFLRCLLVALCGVGAMLVTCNAASAQNLETALMPGQVIRAHAKVEEECKKCHVPFEKNAQDRLCVDCHKDISVDLQQKRGLHGKQQRAACRTCHTDHKGRNADILKFDKANFKHDSLTEYRLEGAHRPLKCESCHAVNKKYRDSPKVCDGCHRKDDVHKGSLGPKCESCHAASATSGWKDVRFDHDKDTKFELLGSHAKVKCATCHVGNKYKGVPTTCVGCHKKDDKHKGFLGERCESCHGVKTWKSTFNHDVDTTYALRGKHRVAKCESCHTAAPARLKLPSQCNSCHKADDKHQGTLGTQCGDCHTERKWTESKFDHSTTTFSLDGKHREAECKACHPKSPNFKNAPKECFACHEKDDRHKATLGKECQTCHSAKDWRVPNFDHAKTRFPLLDKHRIARCDACHTKPDHYRNIASTCVSCHQKDDTHKGDYGDRCDTCHNARDWKAYAFDHNKLTKFSLSGSHSPLTCNKCHTGPLYTKKTETACVSCHQKDDVHKGELGKDCVACHADTKWTKTYFNHDKTKYPLTGAHRLVTCKSCHATSRYLDALKTCVGCHKKDDVHKTTLGEKCESCHVTRTWLAWQFDHDRDTKFALDGGHKKVDCKTCHAKPLAAVLGAKCDSCHQRDDIHNGGFGRRCEQCHYTKDWRTLRLGAKGARQ